MGPIVIFDSHAIDRRPGGAMSLSERFAESCIYNDRTLDWSSFNVIPTITAK